MVKDGFHVLLDKKRFGGFVPGLQADFQALDLLLKAMDIRCQDGQGFMFLGELDDFFGQAEMFDEIGLDGGVAMVAGTLDVRGGEERIDLIKNNGFQP